MRLTGRKGNGIEKWLLVSLLILRVSSVFRSKEEEKRSKKEESRYRIVRKRDALLSPAGCDKMFTRQFPPPNGRREWEKGKEDDDDGDDDDDDVISRRWSNERSSLSLSLLPLLYDDDDNDTGKQSEAKKHGRRHAAHHSVMSGRSSESDLIKRQDEVGRGARIVKQVISFGGHFSTILLIWLTFFSISLSFILHIL